MLVYHLRHACRGAGLASVGTKNQLLGIDQPGDRVVDMFVQLTDTTTKHVIFEQMTNNDGTLRVLICSIAFGMGVDVAGVKHVIHDSAPHTLEEYVQDMGRAARRGGEHGRALL